MSAPSFAACLLAALLCLASCARPGRGPAPPETAPADAQIAEPDAGVALLAEPPPADAAVIASGPPDAVPLSACPAKIEPRRAGPCTIGDHCEVPDGVCFCDGYHGGIPPRPGVDYSHWTCGRSRMRTDGCPDNIKAGARCPTEGQACPELEGLFCGQILECRRRQWVPTSDTCSTIP